MKYYIITPEVASKLGVESFRVGNAQVGYLVNQSDLGYNVSPDSTECKRLIKRQQDNFL